MIQEHCFRCISAVYRFHGHLKAAITWKPLTTLFLANMSCHYQVHLPHFSTIFLSAKMEIFVGMMKSTAFFTSARYPLRRLSCVCLENLPISPRVVSIFSSVQPPIFIVGERVREKRKHGDHSRNNGTKIIMLVIQSDPSLLFEVLAKHFMLIFMIPLIAINPFYRAVFL